MEEQFFGEEFEDVKHKNMFQLIQHLTVLLDDKTARAFPLRDRQQMLTCADCGAYEYSSVLGGTEVFEEDDRSTGHKSFLMIDAKSRTLRPAGHEKEVIIYSFICPVCGLYQTKIVPVS